jgi:hypothetical protein
MKTFKLKGCSSGERVRLQLHERHQTFELQTSSIRFQRSEFITGNKLPNTLAIKSAMTAFMAFSSQNRGKIWTVLLLVQVRSSLEDFTVDRQSAEEDL